MENTVDKSTSLLILKFSIILTKIDNWKILNKWNVWINQKLYSME